MVETAAVLAATVPGKTIVLTGAMIPYAFGSSDGLFNLGSALSFAQVLPAGVYVAMNGTAFAWNRVQKEPRSQAFSNPSPDPIRRGTAASHDRTLSCFATIPAGHTVQES